MSLPTSHSPDATPRSLRLRAQNILASWAVIGLACAIFVGMPYNRSDMAAVYGLLGLRFSGQAFMWLSACCYGALVAFWYLLEAQPQVSKSLRSWQVLWRFLQGAWQRRRDALDEPSRVALLTTMLKAFFAPLMTLSLMQFCTSTLAHGEALLQDAALSLTWLSLFERHGHWFLLKLLFFVDVLVYTVGYLLESQRLGNTIKSVDPSWLGWTAALLCYPPFNQFSNALFGGQVSDFPQFANPTLHVALNLLMLLCIAGYSMSSLALGLKASNLTHRGIVSRGMYALVRHPAYTCKNMAWLIGSLPAITVSFSESLYAGVLALAAVVGWASLYVLRALTEEDHLRRVDGAYAHYAAKVRYRFIPGVV